MGIELLVLAVLAIGGLFLYQRHAQGKRLADAREEAQRWYERLGGQVLNLQANDDPAVKQALVDAGERYTAAGSQLERARSPQQYLLAGDTALEGLHYVRAARTAMGLDAGPDLPKLPTQRRAGELTKEREVNVDGHTYRAGPNAAPGTPYYYPGGYVGGRPVPGGWYSEPWWKTALVAGATTVGTMMLFDALFSPSWGDPGYGGYDQGFQQGLDYADQHGWDPGGNDGGGDQGGWGGGDGSWDSAGFDGGGDFGGDFTGGDFF